jgi:hypothetical protein
MGWDLALASVRRCNWIPTHDDLGRVSTSSAEGSAAGDLVERAFSLPIVLGDKR